MEEDIKKDFNIDDFEFGDIIFAKRYKTEEVKYQIPFGHRIGPYIVVDKKDDTLVCLYGTSSSSINDENIFEFVTNKKTNFLLNHIAEINEDRFKFKIGSISERGKNILKYQLGIINNYPELEVGNIVDYQNNLYYVRKKSDKTYLISVSKIKKNDAKFIVSQNNKYYILFDEEKEIENNSEVRLIKIINDSDKDLIEKKYLENKYESKITSFDRGMLVSYNKILYYVYGLNKDNFECYLVSEEEAAPYIKVNGRKYSAMFSEIVEIKKDVLIEVVDKATLEEIEYNKTKKKQSTCPPSKPNSQKIKKENVTLGTIVTDKTLAHEKYVVVSREQNNLLLIPFNDIENNNYNHLVSTDINEIRYFDKYDFDLFFELMVRISENYSDVATKKLMKELINVKNELNANKNS